MIAVIGILTAILVPTILGLFRRTDDMQREIEISQMTGALEAFNTEYGFYPPDFSNITSATDMLPYLTKIAPNHQELTLAFPSGPPSGPTRLDAWWDAVGRHMHDPMATEGPDAVFGHEHSLVFWLSFLRDDSQFPLTGTGENKEFFEFEQGRLHSFSGRTGTVDIEGGGLTYSVSHYEQDGGGEAPYVYFHNTSYGQTFFPTEGDGECAAVLEPNQDNLGDRTTWPYFSPDRFQIICAGDDLHFGTAESETVDSLTYFFIDPLSDRDASDNITDFSAGRIDTMESLQ